MLGFVSFNSLFDGGAPMAVSEPNPLQLADRGGNLRNAPQPFVEVSVGAIRAPAPPAFVPEGCKPLRQVTLPLSGSRPTDSATWQPVRGNGEADRNLHLARVSQMVSNSVRVHVHSPFGLGRANDDGLHGDVGSTGVPKAGKPACETEQCG